MRRSANTKTVIEITVDLRPPNKVVLKQSGRLPTKRAGDRTGGDSSRTAIGWTCGGILSYDRLGGDNRLLSNWALLKRSGH